MRHLIEWVEITEARIAALEARAKADDEAVQQQAEAVGASARITRDMRPQRGEVVDPAGVTIAADDVYERAPDRTAPVGTLDGVPVYERADGDDRSAGYVRTVDAATAALQEKIRDPRYRLATTTNRPAYADPEIGKLDKTAGGELRVYPDFKPSTADTLAACPFCPGGTGAVGVQAALGWAIICTACHARGPAAETADEARAAWNRAKR